MIRPVLPGDVSAVARALLAVPEGGRQQLCRRIFGGAEEAAVHCRLFGRPHPHWGDGSLSAAARQYLLAVEPFLDDAEYLICTRLVLRELAAALEADAACPAR
ncbi:hypothetical protein [Leisingera sp. ANG59]|uniref:DUF7742 family protein n=1 Tax=Leisingera sp. ANG59 TaxID=2675221 RepID=UPI001573D11F|nr:hypothetical protein [Leisingera sp. ANG59]NSY36929.1 hypothetical protein [Leisingera sp. ANG59]